MLKLTNLNKNFENKIIFKNFNLSLKNKNLYLLEGENGKGKTTLFRILSGLDKDYKGEITFENNKLDFKDVFYYDIDFNLYDVLNVKKNLSIVSNKYLPLIKNLNLEYLLNKKVNELSKGEKARIGILKGILLNKSILLLDEPFTYLDLDNSKKLFELIKNIVKII